VCTRDTERPGASQERDHPVRTRAWGLRQPTARSACWRSSPRSPSPRRPRSVPCARSPLHTRDAQAVSSRARTAGPQRGNVEAQRLSRPTGSAAGLPAPEQAGPEQRACAVPQPRGFRTGLHHHVHVLRVTQHPAIIYGLLLGRVCLVQRKQAMITRSLAGRCFLWYLEKPRIWQTEQPPKRKIDAKYQTFYTHLLFSDLFQQPGWLAVSWFKDRTVQTVHSWFWVWSGVEQITVLESNWKLSRKQQLSVAVKAARCLDKLSY